MTRESEQKKNALEALFVDSDDESVSRLLMGALEGRVSFERNTGRLIPRAGLYKLPQQPRLLILLLARHALVRLGMHDTEIEISTELLSQEGQISIKTAREQLSRLRAQGVIEKGSKGYRVPDWGIWAATERLHSNRED